jgi:hypothetical protein
MSDWPFNLRPLPYRHARPEKLLGFCPRCRITVVDNGQPLDPNRCPDKRCPPLEPVPEGVRR